MGHAGFISSTVSPFFSRDLGRQLLGGTERKGMNSGNPGPLTADRGGPFLPKEGSISTISILILVLILD